MVSASKVVATPLEDGAKRVMVHFVEGSSLGYEMDGRLRTEPDEEVAIVLDRAMVVRTIRELYRACVPADAARAFRVVSPDGPSDLLTWDDALAVLEHAEHVGRVVRLAREESDELGKPWLVDVPRVI